MALLEVDGVVAGYGIGPDIVNEVSLSVEEGSSYCIVGPNGAGKSTLLKAIAGVLKPRSGTIRLMGSNVGGLRPDQVLASGICFIPQEASLFPSMSVQENLRMGAYLIHDRDLIHERLAVVYGIFPALGERKGQLAGTLSGGEQQMVALGRGLMIEPKVLMIDEPSLGLAPTITDQIFEKIEEFQTLGITVVLVEQNAYRGLACTDWGVVLDLGSKQFEGPADSILADPRIRELYLGKQLARRHGRP
jgi:branched-chain amino acid transport system ATP-binding protein